MKKLIPSSWRVNLQVYKRVISDQISGQARHMINGQATIWKDGIFAPQISLTQPLGRATAHYLDCKKHNLTLAIQRIQNVVLQPGQILSFWHLVGNPTVKKGYVEGRSLTVQGLGTSIGGGLCQLSGMLYFLSLKAGLKIIERHPHSKDIYTDDTRFAPLGSDAAVVYGYKDLRVGNPFPFPICFRFSITDQEILALLYSCQAITELRVEFRAQTLDSGTHVETIRYLHSSEKAEVISADLYPKLLLGVIEA